MSYFTMKGSQTEVNCFDFFFFERLGVNLKRVYFRIFCLVLTRAMSVQRRDTLDQIRAVDSTVGRSVTHLLDPAKGFFMTYGA